MNKRTQIAAYIGFFVAASLAFPTAAEERKGAQREDDKEIVDIQSFLDSAMERNRANNAARGIRNDADEQKIREALRQSIEDVTRHNLVPLPWVGATVTGKPYSLRELREFKQTLADGNVITRKNSTRLLARDREGRTRQELLQPDGSSRVFINDPVAKLTYVLNPKKRIGCKADFNADAIYDCIAQITEKDWKPLGFNVTANKNGIALIAPQDNPLLELDRRKVQVVDQTQPDAKPLELRPGGPRTTVLYVSPDAKLLDFTVQKSPDSKRAMAEALLGSRGIESGLDVPEKTSVRRKLTNEMLDGLAVNVERTVETIAAGAIGNSKAIETVYERYYSPELKMNVYVRRSDPRNGESLYRMTDIKQTDPDASAFRVPAGYSLTEGKK